MSIQTFEVLSVIPRFTKELIDKAKTSGEYNRLLNDFNVLGIDGENATNVLMSFVKSPSTLTDSEKLQRKQFLIELKKSIELNRSKFKFEEIDRLNRLNRLDDPDPVNTFYRDNIDKYIDIYVRLIDGLLAELKDCDVCIDPTPLQNEIKRINKDIDFLTQTVNKKNEYIQFLNDEINKSTKCATCIDPVPLQNQITQAQNDIKNLNDTIVQKKNELTDCAISAVKSAESMKSLNKELESNTTIKSVLIITIVVLIVVLGVLIMKLNK